MELKNCVSCGCVDFGNNNFFEVMKDQNGSVVFSSHDDDGLTENPDGTFDCEGLTTTEFVELLMGWYQDPKKTVELIGNIMEQII